MKKLNHWRGELFHLDAEFEGWDADELAEKVEDAIINGFTLSDVNDAVMQFRNDMESDMDSLPETRREKAEERLAVLEEVSDKLELQPGDSLEDFIQGLDDVLETLRHLKKTI